MGYLCDFIVLAIIVCLCVDNVEPLIGASNAEKGQLPYMAEIVYRDRGYFGEGAHCGAAIINNQYIVTTARCVYHLKPEQCIIYVGAYNLIDKNAQTREIAEIITHQDYNESRHHHNIALVRMNEDIVYSEFVKPIALPTAEFPDVRDKIFTVSGFGLDAVSFNKYD